LTFGLVDAGEGLVWIEVDSIVDIETEVVVGVRG
jgi:hypothetical protein